MKCKTKILLLLLIYFFINIFYLKVYASVSIDVKNTYAKIGNEVSLDILFSENSGIVGGELQVLYPSDKLEYINTKSGEVLEGKMFTFSSDNNGKINIVFTGMDIYKTGKVATIYFKVKKDIKDTNIPISVVAKKVINDENNSGNVTDVETNISNGSIKIIENKDVVVPDNANVVVQRNDDGNYNISLKNEKNVTYSSSDENIASVDENGNVVPKSAGIVEITATYDDGTQDKIYIDIPEPKSNDNGIGNVQNLILFVIIFGIICIVIFIILKLRKK